MLQEVLTIKNHINNDILRHQVCGVAQGVHVYRKEKLHNLEEQEIRNHVQALQDHLYLKEAKRCKCFLATDICSHS